MLIYIENIIKYVTFQKFTELNILAKRSLKISKIFSTS